MANKNVYKYDDMKRREHMAVRTTAGWYHFTHEIVEVTGDDAAVFLDYIFPNAISNLAVGKERYTTMLNDTAEIIDDVVVFRIAENIFWISGLFAEKLVAWLNTHKGDYQVAFEDITKTSVMYSIQGPKSLEMVNSIVKESVDNLKFFSFVNNSIDDVPVMVNRAGFTGEKYGYEIYIAAEKKEFLEEKIAGAAAAFDAVQITEAQIFVWTLPTEAGYYYMRDLKHCNPLEVGLDKGIKWDKEFIGKEELIKIKENGPTREMVGFTTEEVDVRLHGKCHGGPGSIVYLNGEEIGRVSKYNYGYVKEIPIGYLLVEKDRVKTGDHVSIDGRYDAVITEKNFL